MTKTKPHHKQIHAYIHISIYPEESEEEAKKAWRQ